MEHNKVGNAELASILSFVGLIAAGLAYYVVTVIKAVKVAKKAWLELHSADEE